MSLLFFTYVADWQCCSRCINRCSIAITVTVRCLYAEELAGIAGRPDLAAAAQQADVMARVGYLLEALRGAMRGSCARAQPALFSLAAAVMSPLVRGSAPWAWPAAVHACPTLIGVGALAES